MDISIDDVLVIYVFSGPSCDDISHFDSHHLFFEEISAQKNAARFQGGKTTFMRGTLSTFMSIKNKPQKSMLKIPMPGIEPGPPG